MCAMYVCVSKDRFPCSMCAKFYDVVCFAIKVRDVCSILASVAIAADVMRNSLPMRLVFLVKHFLERKQTFVFLLGLHYELLICYFCFKSQGFCEGSLDPF